MKKSFKKTVFVAMSGGVDSSVAAALLKKKGYNVIGVTMCFNITHPKGRRPSCCGADGINDAKRVAHILDIPHYVLNFARDLEEHVIQNFTQEYLKGRTPNPCVECNRYLKFDILLKKVKQLGADYLATGHYARLHLSTYKKRFELKKGLDSLKEQSYFLYGIKKKNLPFVLFPIGDLTKKQVRSYAKKLKLRNADKPGSQDICFISDKGYKKFVEDRGDKNMLFPGRIKNSDGNVVGEHKGIAYYTIGQGDKLGIALGRRVYVYKIDAPTNTIYVGDANLLYSKAIIVKDVNFISIDPPKTSIKANVKIRYHHPQARAVIKLVNSKTVKVEFSRPQKAATPGQSAVFYNRNILLGGGVIDKVLQ